MDPSAHRRGIGRTLLTELIRLATDHGFHVMVAHSAADNTASIALHRACGFDLVGVERQVGRKFGRWVDVVILQRIL